MPNAHGQAERSRGAANRRHGSQLPKKALGVGDDVALASVDFLACGMARRPATFEQSDRWATQNGIAGLNFVLPLSFEEVDQWVVKRQAGKLNKAEAMPGFSWTAEY